MPQKIAFKKASKVNAKLRLALCGPAGAGKTFTALELATELAGPDGKIAAVDTEHGSMSKYAHTDKCGGPGLCEKADHFDFEVMEPDVFDPLELIKTIDYAVANGFTVIIADSLSHYWAGPGGELEMVDIAAAKSKGNSFAGWKSVTPVHNQLVDKIIGAKIHVIVTMRTKTEWVTEKDERTGKSTPRKIGLAPIMREGVEFEFDICGDMDQDNILTITKSRCSDLSGKVIRKPGKDMAKTLKEWLTGGPEDTPTSAAVEAPAAHEATVAQPAPAEAPSAPPAPAEVIPAPVPLPAVPTQAPGVQALIKPWENYGGMIACFAAMKAKLGDAPDGPYYQTLKQHGVIHANAFKATPKALACYRDLETVAATKAALEGK